jgi:hypothetical protein|tara:strand:- start:1125 stop:2492 length:1368 start_codon:yes stop_codon:yes gene_type:complete
MQSKAIDLFGQSVKIDERGFFTAPSGETFKVFTPRSKVLGRRVNMAQLLEIVLKKFQDGLSSKEVAGAIGRDVDSIATYRKIIMAFNALDETAIEKQRGEQAEFRNEETAKMLQRPEVKAWYDRLINSGKNQRVINSFAAGLNRTCKILHVSPLTLCQKEYSDSIHGTTPQQLDQIAALMATVKKEISSESSYYAVRMAVRSWLQMNGVTLPRGNLCPENLNGKVISTHGAASGVRATKDEIKRANEILEDPAAKLPYPERRIDTEVTFKFGVETASRLTAIRTALLENWNASSKIFATIERKLTHTKKQNVKKRIFCPELIRIINERKAAGEKCLIGKPNEYMPFTEMAKESSDDLHPSKKQTDAMKEIAANLRAVYEQVGGNMADPYFTKKPFHSLRHLAAQWWLLKSSFDYGFVAKLGHWFTIDELKTSYGEMPPEVFDKKYDKYINSEVDQ